MAFSRNSLLDQQNLPGLSELAYLLDGFEIGRGRFFLRVGNWLSNVHFVEAIFPPERLVLAAEDRAATGFQDRSRPWNQALEGVVLAQNIRMGRKTFKKMTKVPATTGPDRPLSVFSFLEHLDVKFADSGNWVGSMEKMKSILAALKSELRASYGDRLVTTILFGSQARGDAQSGSDIDVLIVLKGRVDPATEIARLGPITAALSLTNNVVISCVFISEERFATEQSPLLINVRQEGIAV